MSLRRRARLGIVVVVVTGFVASVWVWLVAPPSVAIHEIESADAIVMFVGGRGERLETAVSLVERGVAPVLVIPNGIAPEWPQANEWCGATGGGLEVLCPVPDPDNTRGEARLIADLARERGWERVVFVTSDYHLARAGRLLAACFPGDTVAVVAPSELDVVTSLRRGAREWLANLSARTLDRGC